MPDLITTRDNAASHGASHGALALLGPPSDPIDFDVYTGGMEPRAYAHTDDLTALAGRADARDQLAKLPRPLLDMVGSSTERDLQGDRMTLSALQDMANCDPNLTIFLNHDYTLPDSVFGSLQESPKIQMQAGIADLAYVSDVELLNPNAVQTYLYVLRGRRMGVSGGFMILDHQWVDATTGEPVDEETLDFFDIISGAVVLDITHVKMVESSVVGIPANQRSWVECAVRGLFRRTLDPHLAPLARALWPGDYKDILARVTAPTLGKQLQDMPARRMTTAARVYWLPETRAFALSNGSRNRTINRRALSDLLAATNPTTAAAAFPRAPLVPPMTPSGTGAPREDSTMPETLIGDMPVDVAKAASQEDKDAQEARAKKYGIGIKEGGNVTKPGEWKDLNDSDFGDPTNYRYPMPDKSHADNAAARFAAPSAREQYTKDEQDIIAKRIMAKQRSYGEDPDWWPPEDEKALTPDLTAAAAAAAAAPPAGGGDDAPPADNPADTPAADAGPAADVPVSADGTHAATTGTHTHGHSAMGSQGGDKSHAHTHTHSGDANHDHHSGAEDAKTLAPDLTAAAPGVAQVNDGAPHAAAAQAGPVSAALPVSAVLPVEPVLISAFAATEASVDPTRAALLDTYQRMLAPLGFSVTETAALTPDAAKAWSDDQQYQIGQGLTAIDGIVDGLLRCAGIPDNDDAVPGADGDGGDTESGAAVVSPAYPLYGVRSSFSPDWLSLADIAKTLAGRALAQKAGKRHSAADTADLQTIHDAVSRLTDGACCAVASANDDQSAADGAGDAPGGASGLSVQDARDTYDGSKGLTPLLLSHVAALTDALRLCGLPALHAHVDATQKALDAATARVQDVAAQADDLTARLDDLAVRPLGRPTRRAGTPTAATVTVRAETFTADAPDRLAARAEQGDEDAVRALALRDAFAQTSVEYIQGVGNCRRWPAGVGGKGIRPPLSRAQAPVMFALPDGEGNLMRYQNGGEALVPCIMPDD